MPAIFFGHGNPMNAITDNSYTEAWNRLGKELPKPEAILSISAHWFIPTTAVTAMENPRTIHDFGGFPRKLYEMRYPARGDLKLARRVQQLIAPTKVTLDDTWGLDHGTWSVLCHVYPDANVPVVQLSLDETQPAAYHFELGERLAPLRDEGILVLGSGNIVHNLHAYAWGRRQQEPYDWAIAFERKVRDLLLAEDHDPLFNYENELGHEATLAVPTPDHFLPLLYVVGSRSRSEPVTFPIEGIDGGSVSMLAVKVG
jgi:4,5-DOPA dioxygenase extradiol